MGTTNFYTHKGTGNVIAATDGTYLDRVIRDGDQYKPGGELATDVPAYGADPGGQLREEHGGGWVTSPGVTPEAVTAASFMRPQAEGAGVVEYADGTTSTGVIDPARGQADDDDEASPVVLDPALLAKAYAIDTVEGVNGYLDENSGDAGAVLAYEAANRNRTGIVDGRHKAAPAPTA